MTTSMTVYDHFERQKEIATCLAGSDLIPPHFQKKPANIMIALAFASQNDIAPFAAMQSMFVVSGKVGMSASMAISLARKHNVWKSLRYDVTGTGESLAVKAIAKLHDDSEVSARVTMQQAHSAGWTRNAIYKSLPELMLQYRAATFLIRTHFPEVLFGMQTAEELRDVESANGRPVVVDVAPSVTALPPRNETEDPRPQPVKKAVRKEPVSEMPNTAAPYVVADAKEREVAKLLAEQFRARTKDAEIIKILDMVSTEHLKAGSVKILHQVVLDAIEGRGIANLKAWANNAILFHVDEPVDVEAVPF